MTRVVLSELTKQYAGTAQPALDGVTLEVPSGLIATVVGPSGCGKSTLLRIVAGLAEPDGGDVSFDGVSQRGIAPERRGAVMMVQDTLLFPHLTVAENVGFGLKMRGVVPAEIRRRVGQMLDLVRLSGFEDRRPDQLSGGQGQRVALARALVVEPRVALLDEPLSSLDPALRAEMRALIRSVQAEMRTTMLFVTHDREEAVALGDRLALVDGGRILQAGTPEALFERPESRAAAAFFGVANVLDGTVSAGVFRCPAGEWPLPGQMPDGAAAAAVRPEALQVLPDPAGSGRVRGVEYRGTHSIISLSAGGILLTAAVDPVEARALEPGASVRIRVAPERVWILPERSGHRRESS